MRRIKDGVKLTKEDYIEWEAFRKVKSNTITNEQYLMTCDFHAKYYEHKLFRPSTCCGGVKTIQRYYNEVDNIYLKGL